MKWFMRPWISNYEAIVGVAGDVIQLIHSYSFFNLSPVLPCLFSPLCNILFQPVFPYLLSLPLTFVTLCITLSLHHCPFLFLLLSFPFFLFFFLFLDKHIFPQSCLCFVNQLSWLHSSLSFSPSLYLPTRLVITSSTVELMAQFREGKKKKKKEESCSPFIRNGIKRHTRDRLLLSCICAVHMHTCGRMHANTHMYSMHACTQSERQRCGESSWNEKRARWDGKGESGSPQNISQGKPLLFGSVRAAEEEMPLAAQSCMPPVITSNLIKRSSASGWSASDMLLSNRAR